MPKMKSHNFEFSKHTEPINLESPWPDCVNIKMSRFWAWELTTNLLSQLQKNEETITYSILGTLDYNLEAEGED